MSETYTIEATGATATPLQHTITIEGIEYLCIPCEPLPVREAAGRASRRFAYLRVSTEKQNEERQRDTINAKTNNLCDDPASVYLDKETGTTMNRDDFRRLLTDVQPGDEVWFVDVSRFGRTVEEMLMYLSWFIRNRVKLRIISIPMSLSDPAKGEEHNYFSTLRMFFFFEATAAEMWYISHTRAAAGGMKALLKNDKDTGRPRKKVDVALYYELWELVRTRVMSQEEAAQKLDLHPSGYSNRIHEHEAFEQWAAENQALFEAAGKEIPPYNPNIKINKQINALVKSLAA